MIRQSVPLGKVMGISLGLDASWFLVFALLTWSLAASYFPAAFPHWAPALYWLVGALTAIMLFVSVILHELGHATVARFYKIRVRSITLFVFGGVAQMPTEAPSPMAEFAIAVGGPVVSFALAVFFTLLRPMVAAVEPVLGLVQYLALINFALALFNLIPGYPLDGGRVLRAILWKGTGSLHRATGIAASVGRFIGFAFIFFGAWRLLSGNVVGGLWIAFIGWFLESAAHSQARQSELHSLLAGHTVGQAMQDHVPVVSEDLRLKALVENEVLLRGRRRFLVSRNGSAVGWISPDRLTEVSRSDWESKTAGQLMHPMTEASPVDPDTPLTVALGEMERRGVDQLAVVSGGRLIGILSREDIVSYLETLQSLAA